MIQIEFSEQEANALIELINLAVKSGGLNVAQAGVVLASKIQSAAQAVKKESDQNASA